MSGEKQMADLIDELPRDDTGRITSDYEPTALEIEVCRRAICREFGDNGTDGYYIRILKAVHAAAPAAERIAELEGQLATAWADYDR
jgi:NOL1/NOP2/fmu family ribosome biogenesis protein